MPGHIGDDHGVAGADPELSQQLLHLLRLHPRLIIMMMFVSSIMMIVIGIIIIVWIVMVIICESIPTSMVLLNISNMLMLLFSLSLPVVNTLKVHSENCCLGYDSDDYDE